MSENTQLTMADGFDIKNMIFSEPQSGIIPNSKPEINYKRINISTRNPDGSVGELIIPTTQLFSFGVGENVSVDTGKVNGYVMPLCLFNRDGPSKEEKAWVDTFNAIVDRCKQHLVASREEIEQYDLADSDLKKLNPLYYKRERGKIVEGTGPTLYAKLIVSKKQNKIVTMYFNYEGETIDPLALLGKYCYAKSAIKIESIFIGNKISLQVKLYECEIKLMDTGMKRLLKRPNAVKRVLTSNAANPMQTPNKNDEEDPASDGSIAGSDDDEPSHVEEKKPETKPSVKVVKKRVKKVVKKLEV